ncbi:MAG: alpha/beta hydrolase-fold protein, partial [Bacteroidota bacterium]
MLSLPHSLHIGNLAVFLLLTLLFAGCSDQTIIPVDIHSIPSAHTGHTYEIRVRLPDNYDASESYPVAVLLDGYYHFEDLEKTLYEERAADVILVGIFYEDYPFSATSFAQVEEIREVDLTFPVHVSSSSGEELGGGGQQFYNFLKEELIPLIADNYQTVPEERTLLGHSLGGYFTLWQMMAHREDALFPNVVSLSPSLWWNRVGLLETEKELADQSIALPFKLYLGIGTEEGLEANALVDELAERLEEHQHPGLRVKSERYQGSHL